jgi:hypothetical protein
MSERSSADVGRAWSEFCRSLERATVAMEAQHLELDDLDRADGLRFLGRLTRTALEVLDPHDAAGRPMFASIAVTYGIPSPDDVFLRCTVDSSLEYRIAGRRNTVPFLAFSAQSAGRAARPGSSSHLDEKRLEVDADGSFEIAVSAREQPGNWLKLTPDAHAIVVRQTFLRRDQEQAAELDIACLQPQPASEAVTWDRVTRRLGVAAAQCNTLAAFWPDWVGGFAEFADVNEFFMFDEATHIAMGGDPQVRAMLCRWRLDRGEALVVTLRPPRCEYWNAQLATIWTEPIESRTGTSARNVADVVAEADGSVRLVVVDRDPGVPNWLDTGGRRQGTMVVRWVNADAHPVPATEVVAID